MGFFFYINHCSWVLQYMSMCTGPIGPVNTKMWHLTTNFSAGFLESKIGHNGRICPSALVWRANICLLARCVILSIYSEIYFSIYQSFSVYCYAPIIYVFMHIFLHPVYAYFSKRHKTTCRKKNGSSLEMTIHRLVFQEKMLIFRKG